MTTPNPGDTLRINDYSPNTLTTLADLLEQSQSREHQINREAELDDLWRQVDTALEHVTGPDRAQLRMLREAVITAHDLVGGRQPLKAAEQLRAIVAATTTAG